LVQAFIDLRMIPDRSGTKYHLLAPWLNYMRNNPYAFWAAFVICDIRGNSYDIQLQREAGWAHVLTFQVVSKEIYTAVKYVIGCILSLQNISGPSWFWLGSSEDWEQWRRNFGASRIYTLRFWCEKKHQCRSYWYHERIVTAQVLWDEHVGNDMGSKWRSLNRVPNESTTSSLFCEDSENRDSYYWWVAPTIAE